MHAASMSIDPVIEQARLGRFRWTLYGICAFLMGLEGYDAYILANLAPTIAKALHIAMPSMAIVFSIQNFGMALGFYTVPLIADRTGRRNVILAGLCAFAFFTFVSTAATNLTQLAIIRFLAFVAFGGTFPNIVALAAEYLPNARRTRLLTWVFIAHGVGSSMAGLAGPSIVKYFSWQAAFWIGGGVMLAAVPVLFWFLPESCRHMVAKRPTDPRIAIYLRRIDPGFYAAPGTLFVTTEVKTAGSTVTALFRDGRAPMTLLLWIAMAGALFSTATLTAWIPSLLHLLGGLDTATATRMTGLSAIGAICGPVLLTFLMRRMSLARALALTLGIAFLNTVAFTIVAAVPWTGWLLGAAFGLFVAGSQAGLNTLVASSYPTAIRSTGIGWAGGLGRITSIIGPGVAGAMLATHWSPIAIYSMIAAPLLVAGGSAALLSLLRPAAARVEKQS